MIDFSLKATDLAGWSGCVASVKSTSKEKDTSFNVGADNVTVDIKVYPDEFSLPHKKKKSSTKGTAQVHNTLQTDVLPRFCWVFPD